MVVEKIKEADALETYFRLRYWCFFLFEIGV